MAMRVKCPKCSAQYNLDPQKLSPQGTKVRCSSCSNVFVVKRKAADGEASAPPPAKTVPAAKPSAPRSDDDPIHGGAKSAPMSSSMVDEQPIPMADSASSESPQNSGGGKAPIYSETLNDLGKVPPQPKPAAPATPPPAKPSPAPAAPAAAKTAAAAPVKDSGAKWRVKKQGLGLIYGPADLNTVQSWISNERIGARDTYSRDGSDWAPPQKFIEIAPLLGLAPDPDAVTPVSKPPAPASAPEPVPESIRLSPPAQQSPRKPTTLGFELDSLDEEAPSAPKGGSLVLTAAIGLVLLVLAAGGVFYAVVLPKDDLLDRFFAGPARPVLEPVVAILRPEYQPPDMRDAERIARQQALLQQQLRASQAERAQRPYAENYVPRLEGDNPYLQPVSEALMAMLPDTPDAYAAALAVLDPLTGTEDTPREITALVKMVRAFSALSQGDSSYADSALTAVENLAQITSAPLASRNTVVTGLLLARRFTEAQKIASEEGARNPNDPFVHYLQGLAKLSDPAGIDHYLKAIELEPRFAAARAELANRYTAAGQDLEAAEVQVRETLAISPSHARARAVGQKLLLRDLPPDPAAQKEPPKLSDREVQDLFISTEQLVKDQKYAEATANLELLMTVYRAQLSPTLRSQAHFYRGEMFRLAGDPVAAVAQYDTALIENPREARARRAIEKIREGTRSGSQQVAAPASEPAPVSPAPPPAPAVPMPPPAEPALPPAPPPAAEPARPVEPGIPPPATDLPPLPE